MANTLKFGSGTWATKKGSTLAYNDEGGNFKPLPFTYTGAGKGTRVNKEGLIEVVENDRPRIDYTDSEDGVFLLEKASTNLATYSEDFSQSYWVKIGSSVVGGFSSPSADSPLGAFKLVEDTTGNRHGINHTFVGINSSADYSFSINIKSNGRQWVYFKPFDWINSYIWFDVLNGVVGNISNHSSFTFKNGKINKMANGFFNVSFTVDTTFPQIQIGLALTTSNNATSNYTGDGESGVYIFGAQFELSSQSSSYIPTQGTIQTRVQETASGSGNSEVFNSEQGVLFTEVSLLSNSGAYKDINIRSADGQNIVTMRFSASVIGTTTFVYETRISGTYTTIGASIQTNFTPNTKIAVTWSSTKASIWINGIEIGSLIGNYSISGLSNLNFGTTGKFYGKTRDIRVYDTVLTDLELETLTSYRTWEEMVKELNLNIIHNE